MRFATWRLDADAPHSLPPRAVPPVLIRHGVQSVQLTGPGLAGVPGLPRLLRDCAVAGLVTELVVSSTASLSDALLRAAGETLSAITLRVTGQPLSANEFRSRWGPALDRAHALLGLGVPTGISMTLGVDQISHTAALVRAAAALGVRSTTLLGMEDRDARDVADAALPTAVQMEVDVAGAVVRALGEPLAVDRSCWLGGASTSFGPDGTQLGCSELEPAHGVLPAPRRLPGPGDRCRYVLATGSRVTLVWPERACWAQEP